MRALAHLLLPCLMACAGDKESPGQGGQDSSPGADGGQDGADGGTAGGDSSAEPYRPDLVCPGDPGCESSEGALQAGAAAVSITPTCFEQWVDLDGDNEYREIDDDTFLDCGCDQLCPGDEGYAAPDEGEADGEFQAVWLAGFGQGRAAQRVHDELWARTVALRTGDTTVAIVSLDVVGFFNDDVELIRAAVVAAGVDVDHVLVSSTHQHEGPDTMGQWGERFGTRGVDDEYLAYVIAQSALSVQQAVANLEPATLYHAEIDSAAPFGEKGTRNLVRDSRDPTIIEEQIKVAALLDEDGLNIATLVNWGNHPEALSSDNLEITSDFAHYLREGVESGVSWELRHQPGVGGVCIYLQAAVGGLMTPLGVEVTDADGNNWEEDSFEKAEAIGKLVADLTLQALPTATQVESPQLGLRRQQLYIPVENVGFQALFLVGVFDREIYNYDETEPLDEENTPDLLTEVNLLSLGPITMLSVPGELTPELAIGGYDGSRVNSDVVEFIESTNPNPPDLSAAPEPPYFADLMGNESNWIIGLGNDEIGYLVPPYDYKLDERSPYLVEAEGDHYEETNSVGPSAVPALQQVIEQVTTWSP